MQRRKIVDEKDARACLVAAERSGIPRAEWARANGVDGRSLNVWRLALEKRRAGAAGDFVELVPAVDAPHRPSPSPSVYRIRVGQFAVELGSSFDEATLRRLLLTVASC